MGTIWSLVLIEHLYLSGMYMTRFVVKKGNQKDLCSDEKFWTVCSKYSVDTTLHSQLGGPMGSYEEKESQLRFDLL